MVHFTFFSIFFLFLHYVIFSVPFVFFNLKKKTFQTFLLLAFYSDFDNYPLHSPISMTLWQTFSHSTYVSSSDFLFRYAFLWLLSFPVLSYNFKAFLFLITHFFRLVFLYPFSFCSLSIFLAIYVFSKRSSCQTTCVSVFSLSVTVTYFSINILFTLFPTRNIIHRSSSYLCIYHFYRLPPLSLFVPFSSQYIFPIVFKR